MGRSVSLKCALNREYVPSGKSSVVYLALNIFPPDRTKSPATLPSAICLLIDRSGSMRGKKLDQARAAALGLINQLQPGDSVSLVTFSSKTEVVVDMEQLQYIEIADFIRKVEKIKCGGGTELYRGLDAAYLQFIRSGRTGDDLVKRVILLSDGQPTDHTPDSHFTRLASEMGAAGISIMCLGIGKEYNENLLSDIAETSHGIWKHVASASDIPAIFVEQYEETKAVVYTTLNISLHLKPEVALKAVFKAAPDVHPVSELNKDGNGEIRISIGDVRAGEPQTLVARLEVPPGHDGKFVLGHVGISGEAGLHDIIINYTDDKERCSIENDVFPRGTFMRAETQTLTRSGLSGDSASLQRAKQQAETMVKDDALGKIPGIKEDLARVVDTIEKSRKGLSEEDTKVAKQDMTHTQAGRR